MAVAVAFAFLAFHSKRSERTRFLPFFPRITDTFHAGAIKNPLSTRNLSNIEKKRSTQALE